MGRTQGVRREQVEPNQPELRHGCLAEQVKPNLPELGHGCSTGAPLGQKDYWKCYCECVTLKIDEFYDICDICEERDSGLVRNMNYCCVNARSVDHPYKRG